MLKNQQKAKVLLVDDLSTNIDILKSFLESDYITIAAKDGKKAIALAEKQRPDLILLDIMMPEINGFEVLSHLKSDSMTSQIPIMLISSIDDRESIVRGFREGAHDYITKPFESEELKARISTQIKIKRQSDLLTQMNKVLENEVEKRTRQLEATNQMLKEANARLNKFSLIKNRFLNIISHEMRTPLAIMSQYIEILSEELNSGRSSDCIRDISQAYSRIQSFSEKALLITQLDSDGYCLNPEPLNMAQLTETVFRQLAPVPESKAISINKTGDSDVMIFGDRSLIQSLIHIILENAVGYSRNGGEIRLHFAASGNTVGISIFDTGPGFPEEVLLYAFQPFCIGKEPIRENFGLSLTIARLIMEVHQGNIEIANHKDGAVVHLIFTQSKED
ncbi:response regulator [bacterium]|nr:response regulator [bacterium]